MPWQLIYYCITPYSGNTCGSYAGGGCPALLKEPALVLAPAKNAYKCPLSEGAVSLDPRSVSALLAVVDDGLGAPLAGVSSWCSSLPGLPPTPTSVELSLMLPMRARTLVVTVFVSVGVVRLAVWPASATMRAFEFENRSDDSYLATTFVMNRETHAACVHAAGAVSSRESLLPSLRRPPGRL